MKTSYYYNRIVESRLKELDVDNVDVLISILTKTESVMAGSFPLQCILGEYYDKSDIDIFCLGFDEDVCSKTMTDGCDR